MINHKKQFERVENTFKELQQEYNNFKKKESYENRNKFKQKVEKHRDALTRCMLSINNIFLKDKKEKEVR